MNVEIANKLVTLRKQMGLSQEELAERIGVSRQAVSKWERSESSPDTDNLIALSKIYGISIDEMLDPETGTATEANGRNNGNSNYSYDDVYDEIKEDKDIDLSGISAAVPIIATIVFLALGLIWGLWHPGWLVFLLVPVFLFMIPDKVNGKWTFKKNIRKVPYPVFVTFVFLLLGFIFNGWAWAWLVYLTIPVWYIVVNNK